MQHLEGKVALIIGASTHGGIGEGTARHYVREGARVILSARRLKEAKEVAAGVGAEAIACDMTDESQVERLIAEVMTRRGRLDVLVIVAGGFASQPVDQLTRETLESTFELNVIGPSFAIKHAARVMERGASIIYVSSATAELSTPGVAAYGCTKAAGERLVEIAALEYGPRGIRLNSLRPGLLETPLSQPFLQRPGVRRAYERETPLGRLATVDDVAAAAVWLASDGCHTTGDRIRVAGGVHLRRHALPEDYRDGA
jgi:NAD(P)-dependent dehydrogenase (short-subunit alcohol dehydrogenase family)